LDTQKFSKYKNVFKVLYRHAKLGGAPISPVAGAAKNVEVLPAALRAAQSPVYKLLWAILTSFAPQGTHLAPMGQKCCMEDVD